jgi:hypothetical protein
MEKAMSIEKAAYREIGCFFLNQSFLELMIASCLFSVVAFARSARLTQFMPFGVVCYVCLVIAHDSN